MKKKDLFEGTKNQIDITNPMQFFKEETPLYIIAGGQFFISQDGGEEKLLDETYSSGESVSEWLDWDYFDKWVDPNKTFNLVFRFNYRLEANGAQLSKEYIKAVDMEPHAKYAWDPFHDKFELTGYFDDGSGETETGLSGTWVRDDGASYIKISGSTIYLCNGGTLQQFSGTYNSSTGDAQLVEGSTTLDFKITTSGEDIVVAQYQSNNHLGTQTYYKSSEYPCN